MTRRILLIASAILTVALATDATAASAPRGVLSSAEFKEFRALDSTFKTPPKQHLTITQTARRDCGSLTKVSRLTADEHAECEATLFFTFRLYGFASSLERCGKDSTKLTRIRCVLGTVDTLERVGRTYLRDDTASARAAAARGFTGKCLDYLIFTPHQRAAMTSLESGLKGYARAVRIGNVAAIVSASRRLGTVLSVTQKALDVTGNVNVCRHG